MISFYLLLYFKFISNFLFIANFLIWRKNLKLTKIYYLIKLILNIYLWFNYEILFFTANLFDRISGILGIIVSKFDDIDLMQGNHLCL